MGSKWKYALGIVTIGAIVGGTIYAIKKAKELEKEQAEAITLEEARAIVESGRKGSDEEAATEEEPTVELPEQVKVEIVSPIQAFRPEEIELETEEDYAIAEILEDDPLRDDYPMGVVKADVQERPVYTVEPLTEFYYYEDGIDPKEDKKLRHDPNSVEAKHQYIRMELADWRCDHDVYRFLIQLFEFPFQPQNDGDEMLRTQVIDNKVQFFGWNSRWNKEVSFADIIFHYARLAEFNCGETVQYWVEYFLDRLEWGWDMPSHEIDQLINKLNSHSYFNAYGQTFGLFGLSRQSMDEAIRTAGQRFDGAITYEIEFNEFLKSCVS